jgi:flavin reductase (DIM6/NTAB) family NADH-FMN oxidoreductase RutF
MEKHKALQKLSNGYYILTALKPADELKTRDKDYIAAGIINWASQVSFDPLQIAVSVQEDSHINETIDYSGNFTLHVLSQKQLSLIEKFSEDSEITDDRINGVPYAVKDGMIGLKETLASIDCNLSDSVRCGDHTLHIGEVINSHVLEDETPLTTNERPSSYQGEK